MRGKIEWENGIENFEGWKIHGRHAGLRIEGTIKTRQWRVRHIET
jgi:hypothetical protein